MQLGMASGRSAAVAAWLAVQQQHEGLELEDVAPQVIGAAVAA